MGKDNCEHPESLGQTYSQLSKTFDPNTKIPGPAELCGKYYGWA